MGKARQRPPAIRDRVRDLRRVRAGDLIPNAKNWRQHPDRQREALAGALAEIGYADALIARELSDGKLELIDGHLRAETTPDTVVPVLVVDLTAAEADTLLATLDPLAAMAQTDGAHLAELLAGIQAGDSRLAELLESLRADALPPVVDPAAELTAARAKLAERFGVPPFSVLDARQGYWQDRKRAWLALGIQSELGRGESAILPATPPGEKRRYDEGPSGKPPKRCASPGGSPRPAMRLQEGRAVRGDGKGRPLKSGATRGQSENLRAPDPVEKAADPAPLSIADLTDNYLADLTPIQEFPGPRWAKRDDFAFYIGPDRASGSKVRQFSAMAAAAPGLPLIVGCSADSCQQIYVADAGERLCRRAVAVVPKRRSRSEATSWAADHGAEIVEVEPGYPAQYRARAREIARDAGGAVRWNVALAVEDTAAQCQNLPAGVRRIIVPTGSGLVAAGALRGTAGSEIEIVAVCVSGLAKRERILGAAKIPDADADRLRMLPPSSPYGQPAKGRLPNGDILDPFYAAKAVPHWLPGDLLWVTGCRPKILCAGG